MKDIIQRIARKMKLVTPGVTNQELRSIDPITLDKGWDIQAVSPISVQRLMGENHKFGDFTSKLEDVQKAGPVYQELVKSPLAIAVATNNSRSTTEYWVYGPQVNGLEINALFYAYAPGKRYGLDSVDITTDWENLFTDDSKSGQDRLARHRAMAGWGWFEPECEIIRQTIDRDVNDVWHGDLPPLRPLARWRTEGDSRQWVFSYSETEAEAGEYIENQVRKVLSYQQRGRIAEGKTILGLAMIGGFDPAVTAKWKKSEGYTDGKGPKNYISSTQILALSLRRADQFLNSPVLAALEEHAKGN